MAPLAWVRRVASELPELNAIPLFGNAPPFDWHRFSSLIASRFSVPHLKIHPREQKWRESSDIKKGLGTNVTVLPIAISPLGTAYWMISQEDLSKLTAWMMNPESKPKALSSEVLQEGFYRYLVLEALESVQGIAPFQDLTLQMSEEELFLEKNFCIDVEIGWEIQSCWGRLAIPVELHGAWVNHFSQMPSEYIPTELARMTELVVGVKTGSVQLHQEEWNKLEVGDFVLLDQESYDAHKGTGVATLMLQNTPVFNVKIKQNKIELIDYAFYYEDHMEQKAPQQGEVVALKELPLFVTVEIGRLKISLDQLMHLTPGNTLELPIHPDQSVSLTVNGQMVGRAELVYLGENLGIRILEMG